MYSVVYGIIKYNSSLGKANILIIKRQVGIEKKY